MVLFNEMEDMQWGELREEYDEVSLANILFEILLNFRQYLQRLLCVRRDL